MEWRSPSFHNKTVVESLLIAHLYLCTQDCICWYHPVWEEEKGLKYSYIPSYNILPGTWELFHHSERISCVKRAPFHFYIQPFTVNEQMHGSVARRPLGAAAFAAVWSCQSDTAMIWIDLNVQRRPGRCCSCQLDICMAVTELSCWLSSAS